MDLACAVVVAGDHHATRQFRPFGHDHKAIQDKACRKLIARGVEWAATGSVAGD